jgi:acyl-CoA reductase-like NAD-dependent aldehyde dehydrogenase
VTANRGQACIGVRRVFVQRKVLPSFLEHLRGLAAAAQPVRLAQGKQAEQANRLVQEAVACGAKSLVPADGMTTANTFRPTVLVDVRPEMAICREATFAPIVSVLAVDDMAEALRENVQCGYGLGASIFSTRADQAVALARQVPAGMVTINDTIYPTTHPATPFGGRGQSGWGVTQGDEGLLEMTVPQVITLRRGTFRPHYDLVQRKDERSLLVEGLLEAGHGVTLWQRVRGLWKVVRALAEARG